MSTYKKFNLDVEHWFPVKGYEGKYEVSNYGKVRSLNYNGTGEVRELKPVMDNYGYKVISLWNDGNKRIKKIHRLVWEAFCCEIPKWANGKLCINHLDEDKTNNNLLNLELCTIKRNSNWGARNKKLSKSKTNHPSLSKRVDKLDVLTGEVLATYPSTREAQRLTGCYQTAIVQCCLGKQKTTGGYAWRYVNEK